MKQFDIEELKLEALKYLHKTSFKNGNRSMYNYCCNNSLLEEVAPHFPKSKQIISKWTDEKLKLEALKYNSRGEFYKINSSAYEISKRKGVEFFNMITSHMEKLTHIWTDEELKIEASKYKTKSEFRLNNYNAYQSLCKKSDEFFNMVTNHMDIIQREWSNEELHKEAFKYSYLKDFRQFSQSAHDIAYRRGILESISLHFNIPYSQDQERLIYAYEFEDNHVYIGLTNDFRFRDFKRNNDQNDAVTIHKNKTNLTPNIKFLTEKIEASEASKMEIYFMEIYTKNNWILLNRCKGGSLGGNYHKTK